MNMSRGKGLSNGYAEREELRSKKLKFRYFKARFVATNNGNILPIMIQSKFIPYLQASKQLVYYFSPVLP